ncbi:MAG: hypothetical protein PSN34_06235 [Urechidicola sp.]|nr:hypothetical protein [Urechidicola sp.]
MILAILLSVSALGVALYTFFKGSKNSVSVEETATKYTIKDKNENEILTIKKT